MQTTIKIKNIEIQLPIYVPDGTFGVVRAVDAQDLVNCGIRAVMMNTFHLMQKPGSSTIEALDGLPNLTGWDGPLFTDSGGFQAYSLFRQNPGFGNISNAGISFTPEGSRRKFLLTPEKCIRLQMSYGSHLLFCLDDCTHVDEAEAEQEIAVQRTITWAKRCKNEFLKQVEQKEFSGKRPLLFAVVQGGNSRSLRQYCAEALLEIGFDGYGYGGWPLDSEGFLVEEMVACTREFIPLQFPLHALGIGHPDFIARCHALGYSLFDSAMPTRDARHGRLYRFTSMDKRIDFSDSRWWEYVYIHDQRHIKSSQLISANCDCHTCRNYPIAYLHHLFKLNDCLYQRLATIHNLRFMTQLCERLAGIPHV